MPKFVHPAKSIARNGKTDPRALYELKLALYLVYYFNQLCSVSTNFIHSPISSSSQYVVFVVNPISEAMSYHIYSKTNPAINVLPGDRNTCVISKQNMLI
jgi:hypothetical protein